MTWVVPPAMLIWHIWIEVRGDIECHMLSGMSATCHARWQIVVGPCVMMWENHMPHYGSATCHLLYGLITSVDVPRHQTPRHFTFTQLTKRVEVLDPLPLWSSICWSTIWSWTSTAIERQPGSWSMSCTGKVLHVTPGDKKRKDHMSCYRIVHGSATCTRCQLVMDWEFLGYARNKRAEDRDPIVSIDMFECLVKLSIGETLGRKYDMEAPR